ncbi:1-acyl-sn-glycerol-3-phosphate acyltransferase [Persicobacter psychrovividus]|uniref:1-acyl-sn-glycerol-3-phosphate acyltransferase n=1 Tax=Persicobacter psychrovividus TaxID=387638 RepID=A0ABN6LBG7_9BACT|nr:1-acyl-sn-glycerol-3-phosphate acyltransferase [Persicobacter psychrovividus]
MWYLIAKIIFKVSGWTVERSFSDDVKKAVVIAAPHTSNWDIIYARAGFFLMNLPVRFTIKHEWVKNPFVGGLLKQLGAIGIDRRPKGERTDKKRSMVDAMANLYEGVDEMMILVTPEGTRKYAPKWKTGFYRLAQQANVPIALGYLDYENKKAGIGTLVYPSGDYEADLKLIQDFYRPIKGRFPEQGIR